MIKTFGNLEFEIAGKAAKFLFEHDSGAPITIEILKDMAFQIVNFVGQVEAQAKAQAEKQLQDKKEQNTVAEAQEDIPKE